MKRFITASLSVILVATMLFGLAACTPKETKTTYTYNTAMSVFPTNWNPHIYQTNDDSIVLDYTSQGFYSFDYNDTKDGYKLVYEMITKDPEDVTSDYVGKYGISDGDTSKAWKLTLRTDIKWQDGTAITAKDFVTSAQLLLQPKTSNYRQDSLWQGNMTIVNAEAYAKQGTFEKKPNSADGATCDFAYSELTKNADGQYVTPDGRLVYLGLETKLAWTNNYTLKQYSGYFPEVYAQLDAMADDDGYIAWTDEVKDIFFSFTSSDTWGNEEEADLAYYLLLDTEWAECSWDTVGMLATGDYELVLVLTKPLDGFYLHYSLTSSWLVNETLYKQCEKWDDGVYSNSYGTSVETTMSYGPYKLTQFQSDKIIHFEKNDQWYGYNDEANKDLYMTTDIDIQYVKEPATRLQMFLKGELDVYGLQATDMKDYQQSDYCYYTTGDSTFFMAVNPDFDALEAAQKTEGANVNKTILTVKEFRMALSYALNRDQFALATAPTNGAAFGAFSSLIVSDPDNGTAYRTTDQAKEVLAKFWGVYDLVGEGKTYANIDDAIASITGYNLDMAKTLFNTAYDKAIADGLMKEGDKISIKIGLPNDTADFYKNGYDFLVNNYTEAVKGTKLEGKLEFTKDASLGNGFADALRANTVDLLFGVGWTGSALDPYGLIGAYIYPNYQYDPSWDTASQDLTINIGGTDYTATLVEWSYALEGEDVELTAADGSKKTYNGGTKADPAERLTILAALEGAVLDTYDMIPMIDDCSAALKGMKIKYYTEEYIFGVGRGGIKYMTYYYSDADWDAFVKSNNNILNYK